MSTSALVVIDMLNPYDHRDADALIESVQGVVDPLRRLLDDARRRDDVRVLYVNDNYGDFSADRRDIIDRALNGRRPDLVEPVVPAPGCGFMSKVRHSAFYGTALEYLLSREKVERVVLTGQVTEQCVLYSALDAYVRHFRLTGGASERGRPAARAGRPLTFSARRRSRRGTSAGRSCSCRGSRRASNRRAPP
ncbi:cysteine hydrolase family protein [Actinomadura luteofluorescens]|uniref:cysteine hydrolase family protein n=1 Tax=Actinomadura luteofluorescens TaxID=46163 RepID=UPI003D8EA517